MDCLRGAREIVSALFTSRCGTLRLDCAVHGVLMVSTLGRLDWHPRHLLTNVTGSITFLAPEQPLTLARHRPRLTAVLDCAAVLCCSHRACA